MSSAKSIENAKIRDSRIVELKCMRCNKKFTVTYGVFRRKVFNKDLCVKCKRATWFDRMTPEKQDQLRKLKQLQWANMTAEEKKSYSELHKRIWHNKSDEAKAFHSMMSSKNMTNYWKNLSPDERERRRNVSCEIFREWRDNVDLETKHRISEQMSEASRRRWKNMTHEELEKRKKDNSIRMKSWWNNLSDERRNQLSNNASIKSKLWWETLTPDEYSSWDLQRKIGYEEYQKKINMVMTKTEAKFSIMLESLNIPYKFIWYNEIKYPDFEKLFPVNPVSKYNHVSPYHAWDFKLHLNNRDILVDIDGSIHDKSLNGNGNEMSSYIEFNDSKRPYQTDGLESYIVKAYNDDLSDEVVVERVGCEKDMDLASFIKYITSIMNEIN